MRNLWKGLTPYSFSHLEYVILIWNYTTKAQIYSCWLGESSLHHWGFEANFLRKNRKKMTDVKSIHNHSRKVPGAPGHQKTSSNIILSDPGPSGKNWKNWQKLVILIGFRTHFSHFCHADACVAMRRASRVTLNDS